MRKFLLICFSLTALLFSSCMRDDNSLDADKRTKTEGFKLEVAVPSATATTITRSEVKPIPGECEIHSLYILFFNHTKDGTGVYQGYHKVPIEEGQPLAISQQINIRFEAGSNLFSSKSYSMLFVANIENYLGNQAPEDVFNNLTDKTENYALENIWASTTGTDSDKFSYDNAPITPSSILMSTRADKIAGQDNVNVLMQRTVSRFDVKNQAEDYYLVSASIWNGYPTEPIWNDGRNDFTRKRLERFYGVEAEFVEGNEPLREDIIGRLYAFENFVSSPEVNDKVTTCVIIGLLKKGESDPMYYRVNVNPDGSSQSLKRNKVYNITVSKVIGKGSDSEFDAYTSNKTMLDLTINYWGLDDNGIIQFDGKNVLALPAKKATLSPEGETREYSIFTMGDGVLSISKKSLDNGISASLSGNTLSIKGEKMGDEEEDRKGSIEIAYGGLRATIDITQSRSTLQFIELSLYTIPSFPAMAGAGMLEPIKVKSSGPWKAKIYNGIFTFQSGQKVETNEGINGESFSISTFEENKDDKINNIPAEDRYAFVTVYLADNEEVNRTIILKQRKPSNLTVLPAQSVIRFAPTQELITGRDVLSNTFTVNPGENGSDTEPKLNNWDVQISGTDADKFRIIDKTFSEDIDKVELNKFTVVPAGRNTSNRTYTATVTVQLHQQSIKHTMTVSQLPHELILSPDPNNPVNNPEMKPSGVGEFTIDVSDKWNAEYWSATITSSLDSNKAYFIVGDQKVSELTNKPMTDKIIIKFPPLTVPYITPTATIEVKLDGTDVSTRFTVSQKQLKPRPIVYQGYNNDTGSPTGTSGTNYNVFLYFNDYMKHPDYFGVSGKVKTAEVMKPISAGISASAIANTGLYIANRCGSSTYRGYLNNLMINNPSNFTVVCFRSSYSDAMYQLNLFKTGATSNSTPFAQAGTATVTRGSAFSPIKAKEYCDANNIGQELWRYLLEEGPFGTVDINNVAFYNYLTDVRSLLQHPKSTIPILTHPVNGNTVVGIDPGMRTMMIGHFELFGVLYTHQTITEGSDTQKFLLNMLAYVINCTQYGKDFNERFIE